MSVYDCFYIIHTTVGYFAVYQFFQVAFVFKCLSIELRNFLPANIGLNGLATRGLKYIVFLLRFRIVLRFGVFV